jgi:hypothetical protein
MLDVLRKRKRSWIIIFLLGLIMSCSLLHGGNKFNDPSSPDIAQVNGEVITQRICPALPERDGTVP